MLVLTRREGETVVIGGNITVKIVAIERGKIRLGIDAPLNIQVYRGELLDREDGDGIEITEE